MQSHSMKCIFIQTKPSSLSTSSCSVGTVLLNHWRAARGLIRGMMDLFLYSCAVATQEWCMATFCKHGHSSQRGQASMTQLRYSILPYDAIAVEWIHPEIPLSSLSGNIAPCVGLCYFPHSSPIRDG